ncbi:MAG TPA: type II toxin-antitoxin system RelE/ParE family toxin [Gammaproteobacteria bacterium]|nr:type II toxin-antitoxin system RelE/ParE family toxin [Gammaproteobacteria bacterium]
MHRILFSKQADKTLRKMPRNMALLIRRKLEHLSSDPFASNANVTKLQGRPGYRLRVGDWRIIYDVEDDRLVIEVLRISPRGGVYQ